MTRILALLRWLWWRPLAIGMALLVVAATPWWGPATLSRLDFFQVRRIEVVGARYLAVSDVLERLSVDTTASIWDDNRPLAERVAQHPQVRFASIGRKLPGTLVVRITENLPVALVPTADGLEAVDATGQVLPIDPTMGDVDLPVLARRDTAVLRVLADLQMRAPELYDRISDVRRVERDALLLQLAGYRVLAPLDISATRLADIVPVEQDLARRNARVAELDLRFRDQVIARLQ